MWGAGWGSTAGITMQGWITKDSAIHIQKSDCPEPGEANEMYALESRFCLYHGELVGGG